MMPADTAATEQNRVPQVSLLRPGIPQKPTNDLVSFLHGSVRELARTSAVYGLLKIAPTVAFVAPSEIVQ